MKTNFIIYVLVLVVTLYLVLYESLTTCNDFVSKNAETVDCKFLKCYKRSVTESPDIIVRTFCK